MAEHTPERLRILSEQIQKEEMNLLFGQMAGLMSKEGPPTNSRKQTEHIKTATLLLRSLRVHLCLELLRQGHSACAEQLRQDWKEILDCLKFLAGRWQISEDLLSDGADILLLLDPGKRSQLLRVLDLPHEQSVLPFDVIDCALRMADYCLETGRAKELCSIAANLIALSGQRNAAAPQKHRLVTVNALRYLVDLDPLLTGRICRQNEAYFAHTVDANACNFYWYYGFSLLSAGREEAAAPKFEKCHGLCMAVEGERSWVGMRAGTFACYHRLVKERSSEAEDFLWDSLKKIDQNFYDGMDSSARMYGAITRSILLRYRMDRQNMGGLLPEILRFRDECLRMEKTNINPNLTVRHSENLLSGYYLELGDYLQAAEHGQRALQSVPPNSIPADPSDVLLYTNLLLIYTSMNDTAQMEFYIKKLREHAGEYRDNPYTNARVSLLVSTASRKLQLEDEEDQLPYLREFYRSLPKHKASASMGENVAFALWISDLCSRALDSGTATEEDLRQMYEILGYFQNRGESYPLNHSQKATCNLLMAQTQWRLGSPKALEHIALSLQYAQELSSSRELSISVLRLAAVLYYAFGQKDRALATVDRVLSGVTAAWQKATAYLNDRRICELLTWIRFHFDVCYTVLHETVSSEELYEQVLRFKDLPALVGRERNRLLHLAPVDEDLKQQIFGLQDRLAAAELNDSMNGTATARAIAQQLERKEAEFEADFPQNRCFTEIRFDRLREKLPKDAAVVEYFFVYEPSFLSDKPTAEPPLSLDIFVTAKRWHGTKFHHIKIPNGNELLRQAADYIEILQNPEDLSAAGNKASLAGALYRSLIAPVLPLLGGIDRLFLAPDDLLCNLPFEILSDGRNDILQENFRVCRLVCGRDLLFGDDRMDSAGRNFILGNPNYNSQRGERSQSRTRGSEALKEPATALPFSGVEAQRIGRLCRSEVYSGDAATKYALRAALPCGIIHLSTHGVFDAEPEADALYSSYLLFAGFNQWVAHKTESSIFGNGLLTADEISRMDLRKTELVVLSACQSGMGDASNGTVRGLLSAFSAAGARWVISHLWEASDFVTPILMEAFYKAYLKEGMEVPDALRYAKNYLRTATVGELRREGWFRLPADIDFSQEIREAVAEMSSLPDYERPFEDEFYWGGFTAHRTR